MEPKQNLRLLVKTNKLFHLIVAIETDKTVRELAHRILNCYIELAQDFEQGSTIPKKRDLEVSSIKFQNFFISKEETVGSILRDNDTIQCILVKAKPKYPKQSRSYANTLKKMNENNTLKSKTNPEIVASQIMQSAPSISIVPSLSQIAIKSIDVEREIDGSLNNIDSKDDLIKKQKKKQQNKARMMKKKEKKMKKLKQKHEQQQRQKQAMRCINQQKSKDNRNQELLNIEQDKKKQCTKDENNEKNEKNVDKMDIEDELISLNDKMIDENKQNEENLSQAYFSLNQNEEAQHNNHYRKMEEQLLRIPKIDQMEELEGPKSPSFNYCVQNSENYQKSVEIKQKQILQETKKETAKEIESQKNLESLSKQKQNDLRVKQKEKQTKNKEKVSENQKQREKQKDKQKNKSKGKVEKVDRINSIMSMLFEAVEGKKKKNKKQQKNVEKEGQKEVVNKQKQKQSTKANQREESIKIPSTQNRVNSQQNTTLRVASPKVTFHNSPAFAPQEVKLMSPQRKLSNSMINMQKFELEQNMSTQKNNQSDKNTRQKQSDRPKEKDSAKVNINGQKTTKIEDKVNKKYEVKVTTSAPSSGNQKIIVQQESEGESISHLGTKQQKTTDRRDSKIAQLDQKLNKYGLQLLNLSDDQEDQE